MQGMWFKFIQIIALSMCCLLLGCDQDAWNNPYSNEAAEANIGYSSFSERPRTLDPARSYSSNEATFTSQVYEPPLQYQYLERPYRLIPQTLTAMPTVQYFNAQGKAVGEDAAADQVAYSVYTLHLMPGIYYQPHPAFAKDTEGHYLYHNMTEAQIEQVTSLQDFQQTGTRELTADDYVYEIKRLADPRLQSPVFGFMAHYIEGLSEFGKIVEQALKQRGGRRNAFLDLRQLPLSGVKALDKNTLQIRIKGKYPQFNYWLAMPFFAPVPWEADEFYAQDGMDESNISFDWYPVGTGPYMLTENDPNRRMVLQRNPNYHGDTYPVQGAPGDAEQGLLTDAGKALPFVDTYVFSLEKESIPRWNKFLQGYYDSSGIASDSFDQAIKVDRFGTPHLTPELAQRHINLYTSVSPAIYYLGFNMLDPVVGGYSNKARKLRQAIGMAIDYNEYISIFLNGRGVAADGPVPPGIFGYTAEVDQTQASSSLAKAKQLLTEAGYPDGRDAKTGKQLVLNYDVTVSGNPDDRARLAWYREQFDKLGIQLHVRGTHYNRFQEKVRNGDAQLFSWGWLADYPDPENFLFLLYGPNGKVKHGGENAANYSSAKFDALFETMRNMPNSPQRAQVIAQMLEIVRADSPWVWGFYPKEFVLTQNWVGNMKVNDMARNTLKYRRINSKERAFLRRQWNQPVLWPLAWLFAGIVILLIPLYGFYRRKEARPTVRREDD